MNNKLIAIKGRIGSGKDTVGMLIQYHLMCLKNPNYSISEFFNYWRVSDREAWSDWRINKFAYKLKHIAGILLGDEDFMKKWEAGDADYRNEFLPEWGMTRRTFLQKLGTDAARDGLHKNTWVIATFADFNEGDQWIITDMRFPNELKAVEDRGGITIQVLRRGTNKENEHESETALDHCVFKYTIYNNGTIEELSELVKAILITENLL